MLEDRLKKIAKELAHLDLMLKKASSEPSPVALVRSNFNSIVKLIDTYRPIHASDFAKFYTFVSYLKEVSPAKELKKLIPQLKTAVAQVKASGHSEQAETCDAIEDAIWAVENQMKHVIHLAKKAFENEEPRSEGDDDTSHFNDHRHMMAQALEDLYRNAWFHLDNNVAHLRKVVLHLEKVDAKNV